MERLPAVIPVPGLDHGDCHGRFNMIGTRFGNTQHDQNTREDTMRRHSDARDMRVAYVFLIWPIS